MRRRRKKGQPKGTAHIPTTERGIRRWWVRWCRLWETIGRTKQWNLGMRSIGWICTDGFIVFEINDDGDVVKPRRDHEPQRSP